MSSQFSLPQVSTLVNQRCQFWIFYKFAKNDKNTFSLCHYRSLRMILQTDGQKWYFHPITSYYLLCNTNNSFSFIFFLTHLQTDYVKSSVSCDDYKYFVFSVWMSSSTVLFSLDTHPQTDALGAVSGPLRGLSLYASVQRHPGLALLWCCYSK